MQGMSERQYAARAGLSRGAIQKAKTSGRLVLHADGSIDAAASDARRADATDPAKSRAADRSDAGARRRPRMKPVPEAAVSAVGDTLKEQGIAAPATGGGMTFLQAKTANEVLKAQERKLRLAKLRGELVDRDRAKTLVFRLAREERDAWVTWPARVAALMAAELSAACGEAEGEPASSSEAVGRKNITIEVAAMQQVLETHVRAHLEELAEPRIAFG